MIKIQIRNILISFITVISKRYKQSFINCGRDGEIQRPFVSKQDKLHSIKNIFNLKLLKLIISILHPFEQNI